MRYLIVKDGVVVNVIEYDGSSPFEIPSQHVLVCHEHADAEIGWKFDGQAIDPTPMRKSDENQGIESGKTARLDL